MFLLTLKIAIKALLLNKVRTVLTMLGIVIGISAVIILISAGKGAQSLIVDQVKGVGSNLLFVLPGGSGDSKFSAPASSQGVVVTSLTEQDVKSLRNPLLAPDIAFVEPEVRGQFVVSYNNQDQVASVSGAVESYASSRNIDFTEGGWFSKSESDGFGQVAVLGSALKKDLFGEQTAVDKIIKIKQLSFRVVGVMEPRGLGVGGVDQDNQVIIPVLTAQKILLGINHYQMIQIQVKNESAIASTQEQVARILRDNHRITDPNKDDFTIRNPQDVLELLSTITDALTLFLGAIAGISLVVGGIGIMNIMLVSVTERTREIGLRKAIGAKRKDILLQFLLESVVLTLLGGIIGIVVGYIGAFIIALFGDWDATVPLYAIALAFGMSTLFGLVFGLYPANKASKLDPIQALRYE